MKSSKFLSKMAEKRPFSGKVAVVPGGSKGIGRATAEIFVKLGGSVLIIARNEDALKEAAEVISEAKRDDAQFVEYLSCDTTDMDKLKPLLEGFVERRGVPGYLINCVGYAYPQYVEKLTLDDFRRNMEVNYFGQLVPTLVLLPHFLQAGAGHIACISSAMGYLGFMGYATYAPSKFAIVGLMEVLRNELKPRGIGCSVVYPVDTQTPGFDKENESKPPECAMISEAGKLMTADEVGVEIVKGLLKNKFYILPGKAGFGWKMMRLFPKLVHWTFDGAYKKALKKLGKKPGK
ncbi:MAG: SDR family oxidoreductase [Promethearchaeota archaeon]